MNIQTEKKLLQSCVAIGCIVPLFAGASGIYYGTGMLGHSLADGSDINNHFRYLSGLLFAIGIAFLTMIPNIEKKSERVCLLTFIVVMGGLARLAGFIIAGIPGTIMILALVMELVITPALYIWQRRVARLMQGVSLEQILRE